MSHLTEIMEREVEVIAEKVYGQSGSISIENEIKDISAKYRQEVINGVYSKTEEKMLERKYLGIQRLLTGFDNITDKYKDIYKKKLESRLEDIVSDNPSLSFSYGDYLAEKNPDPKSIPAKFKQNETVLRAYYEHNVKKDKGTIDNEYIINAYNSVKDNAKLSHYKTGLIKKICERSEGYLNNTKLPDADDEPFRAIKKYLTREDFDTVYEHAKKEAQKLIDEKLACDEAARTIPPPPEESVEIPTASIRDVEEVEDELDMLVRKIAKDSKPNSRPHISHYNSNKEYLTREDIEVIKRHGKEDVGDALKQPLKTEVKVEEDVDFECPLCGATVGISDVKCPECGAEFDEDEKPDDLDSIINELDRMADDGIKEPKVTPAVQPEKKVHETTVSVPVKEPNYEERYEDEEDYEEDGIIKKFAKLVAPFGAAAGIEAAYLTGVGLVAYYSDLLPDDGLYKYCTLGVVGAASIIPGLLSVKAWFKIADELW